MALKPAAFVNPPPRPQHVPDPRERSSHLGTHLRHERGMWETQKGQRDDDGFIQQLPGVKHQPGPRRWLSAARAMLNHPTGPMPIFPGSFATRHSRAAWISCKWLPMQQPTCCNLRREKESRES